MIYTTAIILGLIAYIGQMFVPIGQLKIPVQLAAILSILLGGYFSGVQLEQSKWHTKMNEARLEIAVLEQRQSEINTTVITEFIPKIQYIDRIQHQVVREFVTVEADSRCTIQNGFVRLHDAIVDQVVIKPQQSDNDPQNVVLQEVGETVKYNYQACQRNAEQLKQLQQWVRSQEANWNK